MQAWRYTVRGPLAARNREYGNGRPAAPPLATCLKSNTCARRSGAFFPHAFDLTDRLLRLLPPIRPPGLSPRHHVPRVLLGPHLQPGCAAAVGRGGSHPAGAEVPRPPEKGAEGGAVRAQGGPGDAGQGVNGWVSISACLVLMDPPLGSPNAPCWACSRLAHWLPARVDCRWGWVEGQGFEPPCFNEGCGPVEAETRREGGGG